MERIVVGTDLTKRSEAAVKMAADLARAVDAALHVVHASPPPAAAIGSEMVAMPDHGAVIDSCEADLEAMASSLRKRGLHVETHVCSQGAADSLCAVAETVGADLIVVGNRRMKGAGRVLGSVPNKVAHRANCSVYIARTGD